MGDKDIISKDIFQRLVRDFATYLFHLPVTEVELLDTEQHRIEDRRADLVARVTGLDGQVFLLHIEIQNDNDPSMPKRMLRYLADVLLAHPILPVKQYLVYIGKEPLRMADGLDLEQLHYRYPVIDMHQVDCRDLLRQDSPDAWVMAVLCDFKDRPPRAVIHEILTRLMERLHEAPPRLREYVEMLEILSTNRELNLNIEEELEMLTIDLEKLPTFRIGEKRGWEKGMLQGKEEGREEGREKGAHAKALAIATELLAAGIAPPQVALFTQLPLAEIEALNQGQRDSWA
jgi:predicted transposase YdaD